MDYEAFHTRILPSRNKLYRFALRFLGSEADAKDVVQDALIRVWNSGDKMNDVQNWEAWCMRMVRNLSLDRLRYAGRHSTSSLEDVPEIQHPVTMEITESNESMKQITGIMNQLPERQRQIMQLRDIEGYSYQEIADILDLDMSVVKVSLFRARNFVREKLLKVHAYGIQ